MQTLREVVDGIFEELSSPQKLKHQKLTEKWPDIAGPQVAPHTKATLGQDGQINVWVDQSTLAYELMQRYQMALLKRIQAVLGEEIKSIRFYVGQLR